VNSFNAYSGAAFQSFFPEFTGKKLDEVRGQAALFLPKITVKTGSKK